MASAATADEQNVRSRIWFFKMSARGINNKREVSGKWLALYSNHVTPTRTTSRADPMRHNLGQVQATVLVVKLLIVIDHIVRRIVLSSCSSQQFVMSQVFSHYSYAKRDRSACCYELLI